MAEFNPKSDELAAYAALITVVRLFDRGLILDQSAYVEMAQNIQQQLATSPATRDGDPRI
jgi:hypothetical protein